ncbi:MAG: hypothetical protein Q4C00_07905, partial [Bacillota bacterium]|nr:hypothetical protein [Bacillota bacterium]
TVRGDLFITEGADSGGTIKLIDEARVQKRIVVRGGSLTGLYSHGSYINEICVAKTTPGTLGINNIYGFPVEKLNIVQAPDGVQIKGRFETVTMENTSAVAKLLVTGDGKIENEIVIGGNEANTEIRLNNGAEVEQLTLLDDSPVYITVDAPANTTLKVKLPQEGRADLTVKDLSGNDVQYDVIQ